MSEYVPHFVRVEIDGLPEDEYFQDDIEFNALGSDLPKERGVYFVQGVDGGPIKIGWASKHPDEGRLMALQTGSPVVLRLLGWIRGATYRLENHLHEEFKADRLHGEWFAQSDALLDIIRRWSWEDELPEAM